MLRSSPPSRSLLAAFAMLACSDGVPAQAQPERPVSAPAVADPVSAAVAQASRRFGVPEHWIRAVMQVESAGRADAVSHAGAMGLMQVMPGTYAELRARYGLGPDPFAVRDNVLAGTAYLREMFDRYGATGMLAAYNAGPGRWEEHLAGVRPLPAETVGYLARLGPVLEIGGVSPLPTRSVIARPSPLEAPIFVTLWRASTAVSPPAAEQPQRTLVAANASPSSPGESIFVRRQSASEALPASTAGGEPRETVSRPEARATGPDVQSHPPANPLFPAQSGQEPRR